MSSAAPVLVIDDGELESVRLLLEDLGVEAEYATSQLLGPVAHPSRLLVTTAHIAHSLRLARALNPGADRATWIAFSQACSKAAAWSSVTPATPRGTSSGLVMERLRASSWRASKSRSCIYRVSYVTSSGLWLAIYGEPLEISGRGAVAVCA